MYIIKDKNGNPFKWSKKGKDRNCWVKNKMCVVKQCFSPENCGTVDLKTQEKRIFGICKTYFDNRCPLGRSNDDNLPEIFKEIKNQI